jgi:hypothetical protein
MRIDTNLVINSLVTCTIFSLLGRGGFWVLDSGLIDIYALVAHCTLHGPASSQKPPNPGLLCFDSHKPVNHYYCFFAS